MTNVLDRHLWMMPLDGDMLFYLFPNETGWETDTFTELVSEMEGDDEFVTSLPLSVEMIKSLQGEEYLRFGYPDEHGMCNYVGAIVIHGSYDSTTDTTVQTLLPCNDKLKTTVHILSSDFFDSLTDSGTNHDPWDTALRLLVETYKPTSVEDLARKPLHLTSAKFDMVTWIGFADIANTALGYWTSETNEE